MERCNNINYGYYIPHLSVEIRQEQCALKIERVYYEFRSILPLNEMIYFKFCYHEPKKVTKN